ncbi:hypothetical protein BH10PLA1_BH10PLA1_08510 [soil metagenome]
MSRMLRAFTLLELLVVTAILGLLVALLLPILASARAAERNTRCIANLRGIGVAMTAYAVDNHAYLSPATNFGLWEKPVGTAVKTTDQTAYWGAAYVPYVGHFDRDPKRNVEAYQKDARSLWRCPASALITGRVGFYTPNYYNPDQPATYGANRLVTGRKLSQWVHPSTTIFCHDAPELMMEGKDDSLSNWGGAINFSQWRPGGSVYMPNADREYYRHNKWSNVLWIDGHVSAVYESLGADVPAAWYMGS